MKNAPRTGARQIAAECLSRWSTSHAFAETLVARHTSDAGLGPSDRALVQAIVYGTLRNKTWLEHIIRTLRPSPLDTPLQILTLVGLSQIFILGQADHIAVSETVKLVPQRVRGVVNGILRNAARRKQELIRERDTLPLPVRYSIPEWLVRRWQATYGEPETAAMLDWNNRPPVLHARSNALRPLDTVPDTLVPLEGIPGWYTLTGAIPRAAVENGSLYIADPSTRYCIGLLAPQPGERILDACAAPGGKSAAILSATGGKAILTATDMHEHRLPKLLENLRKQGADHIDIRAHDWTQPCPPEWQQAYDAVILDVPCSNTGVIRKRIDVPWRLTPEEITRLSDLQHTILTCAAEAVKPGGRIVYSTCSIDPEENRAVIDRYLAEHPDCTLVQDHLALPHREQADGAYAALLHKRT
ncbi:hypothetical protein ICN84_02130 [Akkermansia glycaniphila]|uniref:RsmB/NOP family class I SAM-dependent RNA methyltransferase n=1 Tax=Akkermansia glycaniphila TaxID=1679444 RepID=UPI001C02882E|nr:transcription antitermination factor NusB [Akkermansia glycaniphila]MBT9448867.1 hypothetical protein [Akkermansia glycaniphila]